MYLIETLMLLFWHIMIYCQIYKINFCFARILHIIFQLKKKKKNKQHTVIKKVML